MSKHITFRQFVPLLTYKLDEQRMYPNYAHLGFWPVFMPRLDTFTMEIEHLAEGLWNM